MKYVLVSIGGKFLGQDRQICRYCYTIRCIIIPFCFWMAYLTTRIDSEIKAAFRKLAMKKGMKESELLRQLILSQLGETPLEKIAEPDSKKLDLERMTVRMPLFLLEAVEASAKIRGMVPSRWITALVQSNLMGQPVMTDAELLELKASNRELAAIGRNINQIARAINNAFYETERLRLNKLSEISQAISENREAIRALVKASQNAWEAD